MRYAQGLTCSDGTFPGKNCTPMDLLLDVYEPVAGAAHPVPERKPAYILSHGGGNTGGVKEQYCFQGSAGFFAARGFVAFNIDYRLAHTNGLLPPGSIPDPPTPAPPPPPAAAVGAKLVSHVQRSEYFFSPHPERGRGNTSVHTGPLTLPGADGKKLCVTAGATDAAAPRALTLQPCEPTNRAQAWQLRHWTISPQPFVHAESGLCLDIAGVDAKPAAGLPIVLAPCVSDAEDMTHAQLWQLGYSGALITRGGSLAVTVVGSDTDSGLEASSGGWNPNWRSGYPAVRDLKAAIRYVRANADKYGVDASRIVVFINYFVTLDNVLLKGFL